MKTYTLLTLLCLLSIAAVYRPASPGTPIPVTPPVEITAEPPPATRPPFKTPIRPPIITEIPTQPEQPTPAPPDKQPHLDRPAAQERTLPRSGFGPAQPTPTPSAPIASPLRAERSRSATPFVLLIVILIAVFLYEFWQFLKSL